MFYVKPQAGVPLTFQVQGNRTQPMILEPRIKDAGRRMPQLTINLGRNLSDGTYLPMYTSFLDVRHPLYEQALQTFSALGLAQPYEKNGHPWTQTSGFSTYPLYQFHRIALERMDPKGCALYEQGYLLAYRSQSMVDACKAQGHKVEGFEETL